MNRDLKNDIKRLNDFFSQYQKIRKAIEKGSTFITEASKYYNFILGDEECNEEYYRADYASDFDVDIFESKMIEQTAELLMVDMSSKERVQNAMKRIAREQVRAIQFERDRIKGM